MGGKGLKSPREISNIVFEASKRNVFDRRKLNEMATFFGQFIDHNLVATPSNKNEEENIPIPDNDPVFGNRTLCSEEPIPMPEGKVLKFVRSMRVRVRSGSGEERPQNSLTSLLDLDAVYGASKKRSDFLRTGRDGMMDVSAGDLLPLNTAQFNNAPNSTTKAFFVAGDHRVNEHPVLTSLHTLFVREHNSLAQELKRKFPTLSDGQLFETARKINIAQFQKIVYQDWYPTVTGTDLPRYTGFNDNVDPTVSVEFSTAAFRVGHTMVGLNVKRRGRNNKRLSSTPFCKMFFNLPSFFRGVGKMEEFLRGALVTTAQRVDVEVRDSLRNFLFQNVAGEDGFDLVALNIQRARDHNLGTYNELREMFGLPKRRRFAQVTRSRSVQNKLANAYGTVDKVEAWPGMLAEDLKRGSSLPPLILEIWQREFARIRDGDRFFYLSGEQFSDEEKANIPRVRQLFIRRFDTFRAIMLRHTSITAKELPRSMFRSR